MNNSLTSFKNWFEQRNLREKLLVSGVSWAVIYAIFALILFRPLDNENAELHTSIKKAHDDIVTWKSQLKYLHDIPNSAMYKEWVASHNTYQSLKDKYKSLLDRPVSERWDEIIKAVLSNFPNVAIESIVNSPEAVFQGSATDNKSADAIFQQQSQVTVLGNYQDIFGYLSYLEKAVPNIHWDSLTYKVTEYPQANVEMEFSVLYEKSQV